ncbi:MAG: hypothetical protein WCY70_04240 [Methanoculleus sp.]
MVGRERIYDRGSVVDPVADKDEITSKFRYILKKRSDPLLFIVCGDHRGAVRTVHAAGACIV